MTQPIDTVQKYFVSARAINKRPVDIEDLRTAEPRLFEVRRESPLACMRRAADKLLRSRGYVMAPLHPNGGSAA